MGLFDLPRRSISMMMTGDDDLDCYSVVKGLVNSITANKNDNYPVKKLLLK